MEKMRQIGVCGVWVTRMEGLGRRGGGGRTDWIEMDVDGDDGLGLEEEADHCTVVHHCIGYRLPLPPLVLPCLGQPGGFVVWHGDRQQGRLAMSRPAGAVMGKAGEGRGGLGWKTDW